MEELRDWHKKPFKIILSIEDLLCPLFSMTFQNYFKKIVDLKKKELLEKRRKEMDKVYLRRKQPNLIYS